MTASDLIVAVLLFGLIPLWLLAGIADWYLHRRSSIATTSGVRESLIHAIMLVQVGIPVTAALLLEINATVLLLGVAAFALHEATALWDVRYAQAHRYLAPIEQHVHSFLEMLPLFALTLLGILYWPQWQALFTGNPDLGLRWKTEPLPTPYLIAVFIAVVLLQVIPYGEELWRCARADISGKGPAKTGT